jgi:hypothetical protein
VILAFLCAVGAMVLFGIAAVLQALATSRATDVEVLDPRLLLRLARQPIFLAALSLNGLGFLLTSPPCRDCRCSSSRRSSRARSP